MKGRLGIVAAVVCAGLTMSVIAPLARPAEASATTSMQWGINTFIFDDCRSATAWQQAAQHQLAGFKAIGANSVALAFPIYTGTSLRSNLIYAKTQCGTNLGSPTAARLAVVVKAAHKDGLRVLLRPLLDEASLRAGTAGAWRGVITPGNPKLWFANYLATMTPYLKMATANKVERFAISSELNSLMASPRWPAMIAASHRIYKGNLSFAIKWSSTVWKVWSGTEPDIDAYVGVSAPPSATANQLLAGWNAVLAASHVPYSFSRGTIDEVGIPAQQGAYPHPWVFGTPSAKFDQSIQATWFTMVCAFVKQHAMKGVYFWGPFMDSRSGYPLTSPTDDYPQDLQPATQLALKACFTS